MYRIKMPIVTDLKKNPHCLITGKSGSGKSLSFLWYTYNILKSGESLLYLADFKAGKEYHQLNGCPSYSCADSAIDMIYNFYELYTELRKQECPSIPHITICMEEWFGLLVYLEAVDKKKKNDLMMKVGEILALGRGINNGIGVCLMVQRADSSNFSAGAGSREQFQNICSFGRMSKEQRLMLFSGEELDMTRNYQAGQGIALIDGQGEATEIIVPWIPEQEQMGKRIREFMDRQPSIQDLLHQIRAAGGVAEQ